MNKRQRVRELQAQGLSQRQTAKRLGMPVSTVNDHWQKTKTPKVTTDFRERSGYVECISSVRTVEDVLAKAEVDTAIWEVDRVVCNAWESAASNDGAVTVTPLWQVKVWLRRRSSADRTLEAIADRIGSLPNRPRRRSPAAPSRGCLLNISIPDLHIGKRPIAGEYPVERIYDHCIDTILRRVSGVDISMIHLPVGSDLLNCDSSAETTTRGTPQNQDESYEASASRAVNLLISTIDRLSAVAPVTVTAIRGNHDRDSTYWIGHVLAAWYRQDGRVTVRPPSPHKREYLRFGSTLIMTYHGDCVKPQNLESVMIRERPSDFAECLFREAHAGHLHNSAKKRLFAADTYGTVLFRQLPSLSPTDQWHDDMGFVGSPRYAEAQVYDFDEGPILTVEARPPQEMYDHAGKGSIDEKR